MEGPLAAWDTRDAAAAACAGMDRAAGRGVGVDTVMSSKLGSIIGGGRSSDVSSVVGAGASGWGSLGGAAGVCKSVGDRGSSPMMVVTNGGSTGGWLVQKAATPTSEPWNNNEAERVRIKPRLRRGTGANNERSFSIGLRVIRKNRTPDDGVRFTDG